MESSNGVFLPDPNSAAWRRMRYLAYLVLYSNKSIMQISQELGMSARKLKVWMDTVEFKQMLQEIQSENPVIFWDVMERIRSETIKSINKMVELRDNAKSEYVKLRAAATLLEKGMPARTLEMLYRKMIDQKEKTQDITGLAGITEAAEEEEKRRVDEQT